VFASSLVLTAFTSLNAQTLRSAGAPAEFPAASYKGKQYVDSKGCIYIRAGIDGNVTWVPRVNRDRKVVCGYKPTGGATVAASAAKSNKPELILIEPSPAAKPSPKATPTATAKAAPKPAAKPTPAPAPRTVSTPKPAAAPRPTTTPKAAAPKRPPLFSQTGPKPSPGPKPTVYSNPAKKPAPAPVATTKAPVRTSAAPTSTPRKPSAAPAPTTIYSTPAAAPKPTPAPAPTVRTGGNCPGASEFSKRYINSGSRFPVRCGPQTEAPVTIKGRDTSSLGAAPAAGAAYVTVQSSDGARVVPRHVYDNRQNTRTVAVPKGYKPAWDDDRLNPARAERTLAQDAPRTTVQTPSGYRAAWDDDRLNPNRGARTAAGDAQSDQIWQQTVPRTLAPVPTQGQIVRVARSKPTQVPRARTAVRPNANSTARVSTRSAAAPAETDGKRRYIRVATFATDADARALAQSLARTGLPMRLGSVQRKGTTYRMVLAGPFTSQTQAKTALKQVRQAGYPRAKLSK